GDIPSGAHGAQAAPRRRAADITERLRSLEREKRVADALVQVAEQAGASLALTDVLGRFCRLTVELVPCDQCTIYLWSSRRKAYVPVADCGTPPHVVQRFAEKYFYRGKMFFEEDLRAGKTVRLSRDGELSLEAALNQESDPESIARLVCSEAAALLRVSGGLLFIRDENELVAVGGSGWDADAIRALRVPLADTGEHVVRQAYERSATVFENK